MVIEAIKRWLKERGWAPSIGTTVWLKGELEITVLDDLLALCRHDVRGYRYENIGYIRYSDPDLFAKIEELT